MDELRAIAHSLALVAMELTDAMREIEDLPSGERFAMDAGRRTVISEHLGKIAEAIDDDELAMRAAELRF